MRAGSGIVHPNLKKFSLTEISILIRILDSIKDNELLNDEEIGLILVEKGKEVLTELGYQTNLGSQIVQNILQIIQKIRKVYSLKKYFNYYFLN